MLFMRLSNISNFKNCHVQLISVSLLLLGAVTLLGWILGNLEFLLTPSGSAHMTMGAATCFILSALNLFSIQKKTLNGNKLTQLFSISILLISSAYLFEYASEIDLGIDFREIHQQFGSSGRPAVNTLVSFLLFSISVLLLRYSSIYKQPSLIHEICKWLATVVTGIGIVGLLGHLLNLKSLYSWGDYYSMALTTAIGVIFLGLGLFCKILTCEISPTSEINYEKKISRISVSLIFLVGLSSAGLSFFFYQKKVDEILKNEISTLSVTHSNTIFQTLNNRYQRARLLSESKDVREIVDLISTRSFDEVVKAKIKAQQQDLIDNGFNDIDYVLEIGLDHFDVKSNFFVPLKSLKGAVLAWNNGYSLRTQFPLKKDGKLVAYLTSNQSLPYIDQLLPETSLLGETNNFVICGDGGSYLKCFPSRNNNKPLLISKTINGQPLPILSALERGETGVVKALDSRGIPVIAAYTMIGNSGLAIVEKVDQTQIYEPIKAIFTKIIYLILFILLVGYLIIRGQLKPLVQLVIKERNQANIERSRFTAAAEGGIDNFYIFEAVRDETNKIIDLRCLYINHTGSALINKAPNEMIGKLLLEEVPVNRELRLFSKYKYVIETGNTVAEEFAINDKDVNANWIYWQIVKLGDGVAITSRDITEKKRLEEELQKANQLHSAIIDSASYSIIATDVNGIIISMNKAAEKMLWYREDELVGKFTPEIIHDKDEVMLRAEKLSKELGRKIEPGFEVFVARAIDELSSEDEWTYVRKDGSKFPVKLSVTVLRDENSNTYGYLGIAYDISDQKRAEEYITHIALHDVLTGLPNRALFDDRVKVAIENAKRNNSSLGIAMLDLDHFKYINDSLGHHIGDKLLQVISNRITNTIRPTDTVARMGGDEFAFLFPDISHPEGTHIVLRRLLSSFISKVEINGNILHPTPSIGMAVFPHDGDNIETLLQNADTAMYQAKELGRNGYQIFDNEMRQLATKRVIREQALRYAIDNQEFELFFQPQISLDSLKIVGVEALIRWKKANGSYEPPSDFIALAEETGLILPIGEWVIKNAIKQAKEFEKLLGRPIRMAINISPRQFKQIGLVDNILKMLTQYDVAASNFEIEITENLMMEDIENCDEVMRALKDYGIKIALDDFGTGYSSLSYLSKFKFDRIKIDQSFIKDCTTNPENAAIIKAILSMSSTLGVKAIAEGIETEDQLEFIKYHQCEEAQGFFIGKPVPFNQFVENSFDVNDYLKNLK